MVFVSVIIETTEGETEAATSAMVPAEVKEADGSPREKD